MKRLSAAAILLALATPAAAGTLIGTFQPDRLAGGTAADTLLGGGGDDMLWGDPTSGIGKPRAMQRVSLGIGGKEASQGINEFSISQDGRWMVFSSISPEFLPPGEANGERQVFLKDLATGTVTLLSKASNGAPGDSFSESPAISADGRTVAYVSAAGNLSVGNPIPGSRFVVVLDLTNGNARLGSPLVDTVSQGGFLSLVLSSDGQSLAYATTATNLGVTDTNNVPDVYVVRLDESPLKPRRASTKTDGAQADGGASFPVAFSPDGTRLLMVSEANTLLGQAADDKNGSKQDVFEKDLTTVLPNGNIAGEIRLVSSSAAGVQDPMGSSGSPAYSPDGREVAFVSTDKTLVTPDTNGAGEDVFVKTLRPGGPRPVGTVRIVSRSATGAQGAGLFGGIGYSPDGHRLLFVTDAANLAEGATGGPFQLQVLVKDLTVAGDKGPVALASRQAMGQQLAADAAPSVRARFTADGRAVAFATPASNLDPTDKNGLPDVYVATLAAPTGGNDLLDGGTGADRMAGSAGNDTYVVDNAGDRVVEQPGEGFDTVKTPFPGAVPANVEAMTLTGAAAGALTGSAANNALVGNGAANTLNGLAGNDTLKGGGGKDTLTGGPGQDVLTGGPGADRFVFAKASDSRPGARDRITDFNGAGGDRIVLSAIDAHAKKGGNQAFAWIGSKPFSGKPGQLRFAKGVLSADVNGDRKADLSVAVSGTVRGAWIVK